MDLRVSYDGKFHRQTPQIMGLDSVKLEKPEVKKPELIIPPLLYKLHCRTEQKLTKNYKTSNLLPFYQMPNQHVFNTWIMYLESILKEVHSVEGSEQILLEALNYLALNVYFSEPDRERLQPSKMNSDDIFGAFDRDQFLKVAIRIKEVMAQMSKCSPEVLAVS